MTRLDTIVRNLIATTFCVALGATGIFLFSNTQHVTAQIGAPAYPVFRGAHLTNNATAVILTGSGLLHDVCVNTKGGSSNTAKVYADVSGSGTVNQLAVVDTTAAVGCLTYDVQVSTGITVVTGTGTAGDLTVAYRAMN